MMDTLTLIKGLLDLVEEEKKYTHWYSHEEDKLKHEDKRWQLDAFYRSNHYPNEANQRDALRIISRLTARMVRGK